LIRVGFILYSPFEALLEGKNKRVFGNLRDREDIWGYFGGGTTKIPPYLPLTPAIPREPNKIPSFWEGGHHKHVCVVISAFT